MRDLGSKSDANLQAEAARGKRREHGKEQKTPGDVVKGADTCVTGVQEGGERRNEAEADWERFSQRASQNRPKKSSHRFKTNLRLLSRISEKASTHIHLVVKQGNQRQTLQGGKPNAACFFF